LFFGRAKSKEVGLGKQKNFQRTGEKFCGVADKFFGPLGGKFELWNQAVDISEGILGGKCIRGMQWNDC
jgi:hypothetical protein